MEVALDLLKARTKICCIIINIHGDGDIQFQNSLKIFINMSKTLWKLQNHLEAFPEHRLKYYDVNNTVLLQHGFFSTY